MIPDNDGTPPIVVRIPKQSTFDNPGLLNYDGWSGDYTSPDFWTFTYDGPLPKGTMSSVVGFKFTISNGNSSPAHYDIPISIVTGSGGDTVESNSTAVIAVDVNGIVPSGLRRRFASLVSRNSKPAARKRSSGRGDGAGQRKPCSASNQVSRASSLSLGSLV